MTRHTHAKRRQVIRPEGPFSFDSLREFRDICTRAIEDEAVQAIQLDLASVDYIDSAALGMLLIVRDKAKAAGKEISITNARGAVKAILGIANFQKLFQIS